MNGRSLLGALIVVAAAWPLAASTVFGPAAPATPVRYGPAGNASEPLTAANGDRVLAIWNRGEGAVRLDADGKALDIPAIRLPRPERTSGADLVADGEGWIVGWTTFAVDGQGSYLRLAYVSREGAVTDPTDIPLQVPADQNLALHLAKSGDSLIAAYPMSPSVADGYRTAIAVVAGGALVHSTVIGGELRGLSAKAGDVALALGERIVRLRSDLTPISTTALPADFRASDLVMVKEDLLAGGTTNAGPAVVRIRAGNPAAEIVGQLTSTAREIRMAVRGDEVLLVWNAAREGTSYGESTWDLWAARLRSDGNAEGPVLLRSGVDQSGRWIIGPDRPSVETVGDEWLVVWSEGFASTTGNWKNLFASPLDEAQALGEPELGSWRAVDQWLLGSAVSRGVVFVVWSEQEDPFQPRHIFAARFDLRGHPLSEVMTLGTLNPSAVRATDEGVVVFAPEVNVRIGFEGAPAFDMASEPLRDLVCSRALCLAAWIEDASPAGPWSVRVSRWSEGSLLDPTGIPVHFSAQPYGSLFLATDGGGFLAGFSRQGVPGGTILAAAHIDRRDGEWEIRTSDFAASEVPLYDPTLVWQKDRYLALWMSGSPTPELRGSFLTVEGYSVDGDETGWRGWPVAAATPVTHVSDLRYSAGRTLFLSQQSLDQLEGRAAHQIAAVDGLPAGLACGDAGCLLAYSKPVDGDPWFHATRLFLRPFGFPRNRAVSH